MKVRVLKPTDYGVSQWSGGTTTQLFIYPEDANYQERHFLWRISSATVDVEKSQFTPLYGVKRWIMPLEAPLLLKHTHDNETLYDIGLKPYEAHCFKGEWDTQSIGKTRDFNLMLKEGAYGILKCVTLKSGESKTLAQIMPETFDKRLPIYERHLSLGLFCIEGDSKILRHEAETVLASEETLLVDYDVERSSQLHEVTITNSESQPKRMICFFVSY